MKKLAMVGLAAGSLAGSSMAATTVDFAPVVTDVEAGAGGWIAAGIGIFAIGVVVYVAKKLFMRAAS